MKRLICLLVVCVIAFSACSGLEGGPGSTDVAGSSGAGSNSAASGLSPSHMSEEERAEFLKDFRIPGNMEGQFEVIWQNAYCKFNGGGGTGMFDVWILSADSLRGQAVTIETNLSKAPYTISIPALAAEETEPEHKMSYSLFLAYQGVSEANIAGNEEMTEYYQLAYYLIDQDMPPLYCYRVNLEIEKLGLNGGRTEVLDTVTVTVGSQSKTYAVEGISSQSGRLDEKSGGFWFFPPICFVSEDNKEGYVQTPTFTGNTGEDLVLTGISITGIEELEMECEITVRSPFGGVFAMAWDGKTPLEMDADSNFTVNLTFREPLFVDAICGSVLRYITFHYTVGGEERSESMGINYSLYIQPYDVFAYLVDDVDIRLFQKQ